MAYVWRHSTGEHYLNDGVQDIPVINRGFIPMAMLNNMKPGDVIAFGNDTFYAEHDGTGVTLYMRKSRT